MTIAQFLEQQIEQAKRMVKYNQESLEKAKENLFMLEKLSEELK